MNVFRINSCKYINDLSGTGAALYGARWNSKNVYILYAAQSRALALLETVVHMGKMPEKNFCIATIDLPEEGIETYPFENLPPDWNINPSPYYLKTIGDYFIKNNKYLALRISSVIMPEEHNFLVNPNHKLFNMVRIIETKKLQLDDRLFL